MTKIRKKKNPRHFYTIFEEKCSNMRPLLSITFPQGFKNLKKMDIGLFEVGAKRRSNEMNK